MHTLYMLVARGALRQHKTKKSNGIGISNRTAIATRFLYVLIFCWLEGLNMMLLFGRLKSLFSEKYILHIRLRNDEAFRSG